MKSAFLAASAVIISSFSPAALPVLIDTAAATPTAGQLASRCVEEFGALPAADWYYTGVLGEEISRTSGSTTVTGYELNPANRVIHAVFQTSGVIVTYRLDCNAYNPADRLNPSHSKTNGTYTEILAGAESDRAAVCNPGNSTGPEVPETWFTPPGNEHLLNGRTCASVYTELSGNA